MYHAENVKRAIKSCDGALMVISGYDAMQLSGDMAAEFLQESNFWWLTGIQEPGWKAIIEGSRGKVTLVRPDIPEIQRVFEGGMDDDTARALCGAQVVIGLKDFEHELKQLARTHPRVVTVDPQKGYFHNNPAQARLKQQLERIFERVEPCNSKLQELRAIKQPHELEQIRRAVKLTAAAFKAARDDWHTYKHEYQVEADFTRQFRMANAAHAYAPIIAAGKNACTLHYEKNAGPITKKDCVVLDIGARVNGYAADITRTYCAAPSKRAIAVHAALQQAQRDIIKLIEPNMPVADYIQQSDMIMHDALVRLGLIATDDTGKGLRTYMPHAVSHGLGVDVHDDMNAPRLLKAGMVLTVEPGIYIPAEHIGMRIEDDILITDKGNMNLSASLSTDL